MIVQRGLAHAWGLLPAIESRLLTAIVMMYIELGACYVGSMLL